MARLRHHETGDTLTLPAYAVVGRGVAAAVRIPDRLVSGEHARLWFEDGQWFVRDLSSRNGTWVNGVRVEAGADVALELDAHIAFGGRRHTWIVVDTAPPSLRAVPTGGGPPREASNGLLTLPDDDNPVVTLLEGRDGAWLCERDDARTEVADGEVIEVQGQRWTLALPGGIESTLDAGAARRCLADAALEFRVSRDEEAVELRLLVDGDVIVLRQRAHTYPLLLLARARLDDALLPEPERGWVYAERLARSLRIDNLAVNRHVFRARQQVAELGLSGAVDLIERRPATGQLRLGVTQVSERPL